MKKVICINDEFNPNVAVLFKQLPVKDHIYTIRDSFTTRNGPAYHLVEIRNPKIELNGMFFEPSFHQDRFVDLEDEYNQIKVYETEFAEA